MSLYDMALKLEVDSKEYYIKQAEEAENEGLKKIFHKLADDEQKHYEYVQKLASGNLEFKETDVLNDVKNVFTELLEKDIKFEMNLSTIEAYEFAKKMEQESIDYYQKLQKDNTDPTTLDLLKKLENEEKKHLLTLEDILLYMRKPETWVEHAEFNIRETY
ncbi:ferritin-like domain-containing protein [Alkalibacter saccharofermentans]|uniref:Rubrerythrin n=1 Tax=Alkalibacter saccharofermentans DSM 14828 TaxID=1120975 RepID=A0A1M4S4R4_9FIRM|nr:ferritin family protein [Alkalibacter saccharofermentans]SHE27193.1 Rubrerythrin [Alkalibacter saccharofermentans DSM 14828]